MKKLFENPIATAIIDFVLVFVVIFAVRMILHKEFDFVVTLLFSCFSGVAGYFGTIRRNNSDNNTQ